MISKDGVSLVAQMVDNLPAMWETWVESLGWEDPLEDSMANHSSILAWRIPMVGYSPWGHKELDTTEQLSTHTYLRIKVMLGVLTVKQLPSYLLCALMSLNFFLRRDLSELRGRKEKRRFDDWRS